MSIDRVLKAYSERVETALVSYLPSGDGLSGKLFEAMKYSLMSGGKRIRPALVLEFAQICGFSDNSAVMPFACGIEMVHTYSLIHDDLPCMDNDDMRRGRPSCHIAFGEDIALLAGDALLSLAFDTLSGADKAAVRPENTIRCIKELGFASGALGMVGGQVIDLMMEGREVGEDVLMEMHLGKTGRMIICAARMGCIAADGTEAQLTAATSYAADIGRVFQIVDDILDVTGDQKLLGKPIGSDALNKKTTYASLLGVDKAFALAGEITERAKSTILQAFGANADNLVELADMLLKRSN